MSFIRPLLKRYQLVFLSAWTIMICISLWISYSINQQTLIQIAYAKADAYFTKDIIFRNWVSGHGGVYASISNINQPSPYLSEIKERDITTPSGKKLTLINPAYLSRQINELSEDKFNIYGHITSLNPIRIENKADQWESKALGLFAKNKNKEFYEITRYQGEDFFRFMRPLHVTRDCLKCHIHQGYRVGEVRGGISSSIPIKNIEHHIQDSFYWLLGILWFIGILVFLLSSKKYESGSVHSKKTISEKIKINEGIGKYVFLRTFSFIFFPSLIIISFILYLLLLSDYKSKVETLKTNQHQYMKDMHDSALADLHGANSDLLVLSSYPEIFDFIQNKSYTHDIEKLFVSLSLKKGLYDQIRFISDTGEELVRVDYDQGITHVVDKDKLQNKKNRYYFSEALALNKGEVYISAMDLNIENNKIEIPLKPMIRFATPVIDRSGNKRGVLILNYLAERLIYNLAKRYHFDGGVIMLLNKEGYWMKGEHSEDEWGFMFADKKELIFKNRYPDMWEKLNHQEYGQYYNENGLFTFSSVFPQLEIINNSIPHSYPLSLLNELEKREQTKQSWKIVSFVPEHVFESLLQDLFIKMLPVYIIVLIILSIASWRLAVYRVFKIKANRKLRRTLAQVKELSITDELTQLYNRRYFNQSIDKEILCAKRTQQQLVFCIFDLDFFKRYNDSYGHQAGDEVLKTIGLILKEQLTRASDYTFRLGGEEFGILTATKNADSAYSLIDNIRIAIEDRKIPHKNNLASPFVTASFGGFIIDPMSKHNVSSIYEWADQALYKAKEQGRNRVIFL